MTNSKIAILSFFAFIIGLILFVNMGSVIVTGLGYCNIVRPYGNEVTATILYEIITGLCLLGGLIGTVVNLSPEKILKDAVKGTLVLCFVAILFFGLLRSGGAFCPAFSSSCVPLSGYQCSAVIFDHGTIGTYSSGYAAGNVIMTFGQNTGQTWTAANVFWVPGFTATNTSGIPVTIPASGMTPGTGNGNVIIGGLISGQSVELSLPVINLTGSTVNLGVRIQGTIWAQYWTNSGGPYYVQIESGAMTLRAE